MANGDRVTHPDPEIARAGCRGRSKIVDSGPPGVENLSMGDTSLRWCVGRRRVPVTEADGVVRVPIVFACHVVYAHLVPLSGRSPPRRRLR